MMMMNQLPAIIKCLFILQQDTNEAYCSNDIQSIWSSWLVRMITSIPRGMHTENRRPDDVGL